MTFDNSRKIISMRITFFCATILFLVFLALAYIARLIKFPFLGMSETLWTVILSAVYIVIAFYPMFLNYQFVFFSDDTERIIMRYFSAGLVSGKKNSLEIDKNSFAGYTTESGFLGIVTSITLYQRFSEGVAKYPPVYISALSNEEKKKLFRILDSYKKS